MNKFDFKYEGKTYRVKEYTDGELHILCSGEREADQILFSLRQKDLLQHGGYGAGDVTVLPQRMDGKCWVVYEHSFDCACREEAAV